jgi:DNA-directed RNA polymerase subunit RPC12/RpoP
MFQYETIVNLDDLKGASYTCTKCQTATTFSIEASEESRSYGTYKCAGCGNDVLGLIEFVNKYRDLRRIAKSYGIRLRSGPLDQKPKPAAD